MHAGEAICRSYRFGHVMVDVFPELVTIAVPYGAEHDSFIDASIFVERYTHAVSATVVEDDEAGIELHMYPNTEQLVSGRSPKLPPVDPRLGEWDEPSRRPTAAGVVQVSAPHPLIRAFAYRLGSVDWFVQDIGLRAGAAVATLVSHTPIL